jgi:acetyl-CoA carboxylase carboxyl transferase subunit alpha
MDSNPSSSVSAVTAASSVSTSFVEAGSFGRGSVQPLEFEKPLVALEKQLQDLERMALSTGVDFDQELKKLQQQAHEVRKSLYDHLSPAQRLQIARHPQRPNTLEIIRFLGEDSFFELCGDRMGADDRAIVGGLIELEDRPLMILGTQKGRGMKENLTHNFGMANPEGYRKARRLFDHANRFKLPIVTLIDTPGAYPGMDGEQHAIGHAIAENIREMSRYGVPILSIVTGEASSGGALGIGVSNHIYMWEHAQYTVISPEGCASILWRNASFAAQAAEALKITAQDLTRFGICDAMIAEPEGGAHYDPQAAMMALKSQLLQGLESLSLLSPEALRAQRYQKYRAIGEVQLAGSTSAASRGVAS